MIRVCTLSIYLFICLVFADGVVVFVIFSLCRFVLPAVFLVARRRLCSTTVVACQPAGEGSAPACSRRLETREAWRKFMCHSRMCGSMCIIIANTSITMIQFFTKILQVFEYEVLILTLRRIISGAKFYLFLPNTYSLYFHARKKSEIYNESDILTPFFFLSVKYKTKQRFVPPFFVCIPVRKKRYLLVETLL